MRSGFVSIRGAMVIGPVFAGLALWFGFHSLVFQNVTIEKIGSGLLLAILVSLVVERAVEVFGNNRFDPKVAKLKLRQTVLRKQIQTKKDARAEATANGIVAADDTLDRRIAEMAAELADEVQRVQPELDLIACRKAEWTAAVALAWGLLAAVAGFRVLGQFLVSDTLVCPSDAEPALGICGVGTEQAYAIIFCDILLSAAVLAGGAEGIHQIISKLTARTDEDG